MIREHLRTAWRTLVREPSFTIVAILTLGTAIGANVAVFALVDAALIQALPYPSPDRLAIVSRFVSEGGVVDDSASTGMDGRDWDALKGGTDTVDLAAFSGLLSRVNLVVGARASSVEQRRVSAKYFAVFGVPPMLGREFTAEEDRPGGPAAVILGHGLWTSAFGADPAVVGRRVLLRGEPATVVGVMPASFRAEAGVDLWTPLQPATGAEGGGMNYNVVVRLHPDVEWPAAEADVGAALQSVPRTLSPGITFISRLVPLQQDVTADVRRPLVFLWGAVLVVLAVASVNLAGLLLARAGRRTRDVATRLAIGADRRAIVTGMLVESVVLAAAGGVVGLALGTLALHGLEAMATDAFAMWRDVAITGRAVIAAGVLSLVAAFSFGLIPAVQVSRLDVQAALTTSGTRAVAGGARGWARRTLIAAEVALGVVLLVSAGLLTRSFIHLNGLPAGFDGRDLVAASASLQDARYQETAAVTRLFDESLRRIRAIPGVTSAASGLGLPYERILNLYYRVTGAEQGAMTNATYVTSGYFETLGIPVVAGRAIDETDTADGRQVVVINEALARQAFADREALGQSLSVAGGPRAVVGIVGNVQQRPGFGTVEPLVETPIAYVPATQFAAMTLVHTWFAPNWLVRTAGPIDVGERLVAQAIEETDPGLAVASVRRLADVRAGALDDQRLLMTVSVALGLAALCLTAVGLYALIASAVAERRRELGVRVALGASSGQAMRAVMTPGLVLTGIGLVVGFGLSLGAAGFLRRLVWGVTPADPATFTIVAAVLLAVAVAATLLPALATRRIDPARLLRD